jgi:hypothetical protein
MAVPKANPLPAPIAIPKCAPKAPPTTAPSPPIATSILYLKNPIFLLILFSLAFNIKVYS